MPLTDEEAAYIAHEINRAYCAALGDHSQPPWKEAPEWQRESAIVGQAKLRLRPGTTPGENHAEWRRHKVAEGWVYGDEKDAEKKTHPCIVPFGELPEAQRVKDYLFCAVGRIAMEL